MIENFEFSVERLELLENCRLGTRDGLHDTGSSLAAFVLKCGHQIPSQKPILADGDNRPRIRRIPLA